MFFCSGIIIDSYGVWTYVCILGTLSTQQIWIATVEIALDRASRTRRTEELEIQLAMECWMSGRVRPYTS